MSVLPRPPLKQVVTATRPALSPVIATTLGRHWPDLEVRTTHDGGTGPALLLIGPHELEPATVAELIAARSWAWIHLTSSGADFFPVAAVPAETALTRSVGAYAGPITEYVIQAMLARDRPVPPWHPQIAPPSPADEPTTPFPGLFGRHLVVAGLGAAGTQVAVAGRAMGMRVTALVRDPSRSAPDGVELTADHRRMAEADHLVLTLPLTPQTRHIVDGELLAACRPGTHVINVGRGALIDHQALHRAVRDHGMVATLDVTDPEPLPTNHPLRRAPGVVLSPHIAWRSGLSDTAFLTNTLDNLRRWHAGDPLTGAVDRRAGY